MVKDIKSHEEFKAIVRQSDIISSYGFERRNLFFFLHLF